MNNFIEFESFVNNPEYIIQIRTETAGCCCWLHVFKTSIVVKSKGSKMEFPCDGYGYTKKSSLKFAIKEALPYLRAKEALKNKQLPVALESNYIEEVGNI
jgi:hypothetical protein